MDTNSIFAWDATTLYVAMSNGDVQVSTDAGVSWTTTLSSPDPGHAAVNSIFVVNYPIAP